MWLTGCTQHADSYTAVAGSCATVQAAVVDGGFGRGQMARASVFMNKSRGFYFNQSNRAETTTEILCNVQSRQNMLDTINYQLLSVRCVQSNTGVGRARTTSR